MSAPRSALGPGRVDGPGGFVECLGRVGVVDQDALVGGVDGLGGAWPVGAQLGGAGAGGGDLPDEGGQLRVLVRELFGGCGVAGDGGALPAMYSWFSAATNAFRRAAAFSCFSSSPVIGTVHTSPPRGATGSVPASGTGMVTTSQSRSGVSSSRPAMFQGPLTTMATLPALNWSITSPWPQLTTERETRPSRTRSAQKREASITPSPSRSVSSPPSDHMKGRNCQVPS